MRTFWLLVLIGAVDGLRGHSVESAIFFAAAFIVLELRSMRKES